MLRTAGMPLPSACGAHCGLRGGQQLEGEQEPDTLAPVVSSGGFLGALDMR